MGEPDPARVPGRDPGGGVSHAVHVAVPGHAARAPGRGPGAHTRAAAQGTQTSSFDAKVSDWIFPRCELRPLE